MLSKYLPFIEGHLLTAVKTIKRKLTQLLLYLVFFLATFPSNVNIYFLKYDQPSTGGCAEGMENDPRCRLVVGLRAQLETLQDKRTQAIKLLFAQKGADNAREIDLSTIMDAVSGMPNFKQCSRNPLCIKPDKHIARCKVAPTSRVSGG